MAATSYHQPEGDPCKRCGHAARRHRVSHVPQGDPCTRLTKTGAACGLPAYCHDGVPEHRPQGDPCTRCGVAANRHRVAHAAKGDPCTHAGCGLPASAHRPRAYRMPVIMGLDGEGQGRHPHLYKLLAASDEHGKRAAHVQRLEGLTTRDCLDFIWKLPRNVKLFAYSFQYDLTKMLADLDDVLLYRLFRPELRAREVNGARRPMPVHWAPDGERDGALVYAFNFIGTKFSFRVGRFEKAGEGKGLAVKWPKKRRTIWDVFKFFASTFVKALQSWDVCSKEEADAIEAMKLLRAHFDRVPFPKVRAYCLSECRQLAALVRRLIESCNEAGLPLKQFYGAGSLADAMLKKHGIRDKVQAQRATLMRAPEGVRVAVACSFFGGRFESSRIGPVKGPHRKADISSAYPYQQTAAPCLEHGAWRYVRRRTDLDKPGVRVAVVRYGLGEPPRGITWGPFPFRTEDGSVVYPAKSAGGWVYDVEFRAAERLFAHAPRYIRFRGAWVFEGSCSCTPPLAFVADYYRERVRHGKEGKGYVLKVALASTYGKTAQAVGGVPGAYNDWVWAGLTTAGTRAQILDFIAAMPDPRNLLTIATDGVLYTGPRVDVPPPRDTGTSVLPGPVDPVKAPEGVYRKPLGGWEDEAVGYDVFLVRPGMFFPDGNATEEDRAKVLAEMRARGMGRRELFNAREGIKRAFRAGKGLYLAPNAVTRFRGAKTSITRSGTGPRFVYRRSDEYGEWPTRKQLISFDPLPKRLPAAKPGGLLRLRAFTKADGESRPYDRARALQSPDVQDLMHEQDSAAEQPDGYDAVDYGEAAE